MRLFDPQGVLRELGLYGAQHAADIGSGAGHLSRVAAERLEGGRLFMVDVDKDMLARALSDVRERGHSHVHAIWGDAAKYKGVPLADASLDRAIATNVIFTVDDRDAFAKELGRLVKPGGKLLLIDWLDTHDHGPRRQHKVAPREVEQLFSRHGFRKEKEVDAGDLHYGIIFVR